MGSKYTVVAWVKTPDYYEDVEVYAGKSLWRATLAAIKAKRNGSGCVKFFWR